MINITSTDGLKGTTRVQIKGKALDVANDLMNILVHINKAVEEQGDEFLMQIWVAGLEAMLPGGKLDVEKLDLIMLKKMAEDDDEICRS